MSSIYAIIIYMEFKDFFANTNDHNRSLEKIIRRILSNIPLSEIYKSNRKGFIRVNNKKVDLNTKINISDKISKKVKLWIRLIIFC